MSNSPFERTRKTVLRSDSFLRHAMKAHGASVLRLAIAQTGSRADAEDIYQDVFVSLACEATSFSGDDHLRAWLLRVTLNRCHDLARSWWRRRTTSMDALELNPEDRDRPPSIIGDEVAIKALWDAVRQLPPKLRAPVHLFYCEELSCEEIAHVLGIKPSSVRSRLQRARARLKDILGGEEYGEFEWA